MRRGSNRVHLVSLGSALGVVEVRSGVDDFIRVCCVLSGAPCGSLGSFEGALVSSGSFGFVGFILVRRGGNRFHSG